MFSGQPLEDCDVVDAGVSRLRRLFEVGGIGALSPLVRCGRFRLLAPRLGFFDPEVGV